MSSPPERRTACMLCLGRCDPSHYTCRHCARQMWQEVADDLLAEARQDAPQSTISERLIG
jgi:hypothetical protein